MRSLSDRELEIIRDKATDAARMLGPYTAASTVYHKFDVDCIVIIRVSQTNVREMNETVQRACAAIEKDLSP